jgi:NADH dehydrogenase
MQGLITVFGGSGFIGRQVVRQLVKLGYRVRIACRRVNVAGQMPMQGDVGQVHVFQANVRMPESVGRALDGAEGCVNLVGVLHEAGRQRFQSIHAMGAETVAKACAQRGITRLVQMSALGADGESDSKYARTKAMGEQAARAAVKSATVVRPSVVFGPEDDFFNRFAALARISPVLPLPGGGHSRFQPVFVGDVGAAVAAAVASEDAAGRTYELGGPETYSFRELMELVLRETRRERLLLPLPWPVASAIGVVGDLQAALTPIAPQLTSDQVILLKQDNVLSGAHPGLEALGVVPTAIEAVVPTYLYRYRPGGQFSAPTPHVWGATP